ncbi:MAG TPA: sulfatase-like hydrolase/transferase [Thermoanaerobaculia bacterium]|jgi:arylsulfatase A-like enzyme/Tfp pilus assembly protein PilF
MKLNAIAALCLAFLGAACNRGGESKVASPGAPVIIISIDTLRADHLPAYGYTDVQTPALDAFRRDSILFTNAYTHVPLTLPAHTSLLTGKLPQTHNVRNNVGYRLAEGVPTIPTMLKPEGYESGGAVSAYVLRSSTGIGATFDFYDDGIVSKPDVALGSLQRAGGDTAAVARQWISARKEKPFFFMLHLFEPHSPYTPPEPYRSRYKLPYDGEIAAVDQIVGEFIAGLKSDGVYDKALIVVVSDHGEGLNQHGEAEHGIFLYREALHVPLFVKLPGNARAGETAEQPVGLVDILPTVASVTGTKMPEGVEGRSLLAADPQASTRRVYAETLYPRVHLGWSELRSLVASDYHFIQAPRPELYDIRNDPGETKNVLAETRRVYASMRDELAKFGATVEIPTNIDPEEAKKLAALGYLGSTAAPSTGPLPDPKDGIQELSAMIEASRVAQQGNHARAVEELQAILKKNPLLSDGWNQLGVSYEAMGRLEDAVEAYRKAVGLNPSLAPGYALRIGNVYLRLKQYDLAAEHARLGEKVNYGGAHLLLGTIELERQRYAQAEAEARLALNDTHTDIQAKVLLARILNQQERPREALEVARQAAAEAQQRKAGAVESLFFVTGDALARMQQFGPAEEALKREIALFPKNRQPYASLYIVYILTDRYQQAVGILESMVRANPSRSTMLFAAETTEALGDTRATARWRERATATASR